MRLKGWIKGLHRFKGKEIKMSEAEVFARMFASGWFAKEAGDYVWFCKGDTEFRVCRDAVEDGILLNMVYEG